MMFIICSRFSGPLENIIGLDDELTPPDCEKVDEVSCSSEVGNNQTSSREREGSGT